MKHPLLNQRLSFAVFLACAALEALSYWGWHVPAARMSIFALLALGALFLARLNLKWLFALVMVEMAIGSHGRLFFVDLGGFPLSLRMAFFIALAVGWGARLTRVRTGLRRLAEAGLAGPLLLLVVAIVAAALRGVSRGMPAVRVFNDANAYAFMLLIPIGLELFTDRASFARILRVLAGAIAWLSLKGLLVLYAFSHAFPSAFLRDFYLWQRKLGLTEITRLSGGAVRVFAASDVALLPAAFWGALTAWISRRRAALLWTSLVAAAFLLSLSRSFWLGAALASPFLPTLLARSRTVSLAGVVRLGGISVIALVGGILMLLFAVFFPVPEPVQDASVWSDYTGRLTDASDAAVSSRWNMIGPLRQAISSAPILGSGFGAEITYQSDDPRMHDLYPGGLVTTGAIEWQYLEIWLKMGVVGLGALAWLWWRIAALALASWKSSEASGRLMVAGFTAAFIAFAVANVFTPYLNHPLGWAYLAFVVMALQSARSGLETSATRAV